MLLPFGDECGVGPLLTQTVVVELPADFFFLVEQVVYVSAHLMVRLEDRPEHLRLPLALIGLILDIAHFLLQFLECRLNLVPPGRHLLA